MTGPVMPRLAAPLEAPRAPPPPQQPPPVAYAPPVRSRTDALRRVSNSPARRHAQPGTSSRILHDASQSSASLLGPSHAAAGRVVGADDTALETQRRDSGSHAGPRAEARPHAPGRAPRRAWPLPSPQRLPAFEGLVVVEGGSDAAALRRAVRADVFVLGSASTAGSAATLARLRELSAARRHAAGVVVLLDPDVAGRQARLALDMALPGCRHAFVPAALATSVHATR